MEAKETTIDYIQTALKKSYFDRDYSQYKDYLIRVSKIDGINIDDVDKTTGAEWSTYKELTLQVRFDCDELSCSFIKQQTSNKDNSIGHQIDYMNDNKETSSNHNTKESPNKHKN